MSESVTAILLYLNDLNDLHRKMLESAKRKQQVLIHDHVGELMEILMIESRLMKQIQELELVREQVVSAFLAERGIRSRLQLNLTEISKLVFDIEHRKQVVQAQEMLLRTYAELKELNERNQQLTQQSLEFIDYSLNLMIDYPEQDTTYRPPSTKSGYKQSGLFDTRA